MKLSFWLAVGGAAVGMAPMHMALAADNTDVHECTLSYSRNATSVPMQELNDCLEPLSDKKANIEFIHMLGSTRAGGSFSKNIKVGDSRIANLKKLVSESYPNVRIESVSVGPSSRLGDNVRLTAVLVKPAVVAALSQNLSPVVSEPRPLHTTAGAGKQSGDLQIEEEAMEELPRVSLAPAMKTEKMRENFGRIAARMGQDADRDTDESFPAIGFEAAYVRPNTGAPNVRTEIGGTAASMSKGSELLNRASAHVILGAGYNIAGVVLGGRLLGGGVWNEQEKWTEDFGGEGRLGFENENVSIFAGIGRTDKTSRFGLDVGLML